MPHTSLTLLERVRRHSLCEDGGIRRDNEAWNKLVDLYTPLLLHWSLRTGLSATESEDLVQEVFVALLSKVQTFERQRDGSFRKWLQVVTINKCRQRFRRKQHHNHLGDSENDPLNAVADPSTLTEFWETEYRHQLVQRAMQLMQSEFSEKVWQAFREHSFQSRPAAEVGQELGITANAVRVYSSRVLTRLRAELGDLLED